MTTTYKAFQADDITDFVNAVNAYLATLTNPIINGLSVNASLAPRSLDRNYGGLLTTQTGGGAIATPWTINLFEAPTPQGVQALIISFVTAYLVTNPSGFIPAPKLITWPWETSFRINRWAGLLVTNASAASANWLPNAPA